MRASRFTAAATAAACVLLLLATGCAGPLESEAASAPSPSPAPSVAGSAEDAALAAYTDMWAVVVEASREGDTDPEDLSRYATGGALELLRQGLAGVGPGGSGAGAEPGFDPTVTVAEPGQAEVSDCLEDPGGTLGAPTVAARRVDAGIIHDGLVWRVSELRIWEQGTC